MIGRARPTLIDWEAIWPASPPRSATFAARALRPRATMLSGFSPTLSRAAACIPGPPRSLSAFCMKPSTRPAERAAVVAASAASAAAMPPSTARAPLATSSRPRTPRTAATPSRVQLATRAAIMPDAPPAVAALSPIMPTLMARFFGSSSWSLTRYRPTSKPVSQIWPGCSPMNSAVLPTPRAMSS